MKGSAFVARWISYLKLKQSYSGVFVLSVFTRVSGMNQTTERVYSLSCIQDRSGCGEIK